MAMSRANMGSQVTKARGSRKWSQKRKKSVNCKNPKGFSERAHCAGRKKRRK